MGALRQAALVERVNDLERDRDKLKAERDELKRKVGDLLAELDAWRTLGAAPEVAIQKLADAERRLAEHSCELETQEFRLQNDREWKEKVDYQKQRAEKAERRAEERTTQQRLANDCAVKAVEHVGELKARIAELERERDSALKVCDGCTELEAHIAELERELASLPARWTKDSSLETWFPLTAKRLVELETSERTLAQQRDKAHENLARVTGQNAELRTLLQTWLDFNDSDSVAWDVDELRTHTRRALASDGTAIEKMAATPWWRRVLNENAELRRALEGLRTVVVDLYEGLEIVAAVPSQLRTATDRAERALASDGSAAGEVLRAADEYERHERDETLKRLLFSRVRKWRKERGDGE